MDETAQALPTAMLLLAGKDAVAGGDLRTRALVLEVLGGRAAAEPGEVGRAVGQVTGQGLAALWEHGWQPVEVVRAVRRAGSRRHGELVVAALSAPGPWVRAAGAPPPPAWAAQLADLGVVIGTRDDWLSGWVARRRQPVTDAVAMVLDILAALAGLPALEVVVAVPSTWAGWRSATGAVADESILAKVRALLAKAESTQFEAEAEALTAKAQTLMARHAIDDAVARSAGRAGGAQRPGARRFAIEDPYAAAKSMLLAGVAAANGGRSVWRSHLALMTVVAHERELDAIDTLFTSLLVQADRALLAEGRQVDGRGRSRTRSFRQSFLVAFADRIAERLAEASAAAAGEAEAELATSLLPVLARRADEVDAAVAELFPRLGRRRGPRITSAEGWAAGRTAADLAHLGPDTPLSPGTRRLSP